MSTLLAHTPLHAWHAAHHGRLVDFAGWSMPVQYSSIVAEHEATRTAAGLFDISHMGRLRFDGPGARSFLDHLLTRQVSDMQPGQIRYSLVTHDAGGILDDVLVYCLGGADGYFLLVVNASNRQKILDWIAPRLQSAQDVRLHDATSEWAMLALQGPKALQWLAPLVDCDLPAMKYYSGSEARIAGHSGIVSRTGYTGEDGAELIVPADAAETLWSELVRRGATPAGLGARDTLRLEAGMPLYGHELSEEIDPYMAGLSKAVDLPGRDFPGREALERLERDASRPRRVGLELSGQRPAREGYPVIAGQKQVGRVTSGTFSPTLKRPIAMGYVEPAVAAVGTTLAVDIRGRSEAARVVKLPFYRRATSRG